LPDNWAVAALKTQRKVRAP